MESFLAGSLFRIFFVPIISVALGIYIKYVTRNDQFAKFSKEDIAVGFDLMRAAFLGYLILLSDKARGLIGASMALNDAIKGGGATLPQVPILQTTVNNHSHDLLRGVFGIGLLMLGMWVTSTIVRKKGWRTETELDLWYGITVPLTGGVAYLIISSVGRKLSLV